MVGKGFNDISARMVTKQEFNERLNKVETRLGRVETRLDRVERSMVSKDYLDNKLADLQADLAVLIRKEDTKLLALIGVLRQNKLISDDQVRSVLAMEPFAKA